MYKARILSVDDEVSVRQVITEFLKNKGYFSRSAANARSALLELRRRPYDLIIIDILMPGEDGIWLLKRVRREFPDLAAIMLTAVGTIQMAIDCLKAGAYDYLIKPINFEELELSIERALEKRQLELKVKEYQAHLEEMVDERTAQLRKAHQLLKKSQLEIIHRLSMAAEFKDIETGAHIKRVSEYSAAIAKNLGMSPHEVELILYASPMHDIGKIGIPDHILLKKGKLTPKEWEIMKKHTIIGAQILSNSDFELLEVAKVIALTHHERYDGKGYPQGLKGEDIPIEGRIVSLADAFDALTSKRPYKPAFSIEKSISIIKEERGKQFDPNIVDTFLAIKEEILSIRENIKRPIIQTRLAKIL